MADPIADADGPAYGRPRAWIATVALIAIASRVVSIGLIWFAGSSGHVGWPLLTPDRSVFDAWDGQWYVAIATNGYHALPISEHHHDFAFYPLWPLLIRIASAGLMDPGIVAVVLANVLFGAGLVLAALVLARTYGDAIALRGVALLAFSPPAFVFSLAYSESLFLALAAAYFLLATTALRRSLLIASAVVSRVTGVGLVAAAFATAWRGDGSARRIGLIAAAAGLIAFGTWWTFIAVLTHDPFGFLHGALGWQSSSGLVPLAEALRSVEPVSLLEYGFAGLILAASIAMVRQDRPLAAFAILAVSLGLVFGRESSIDRYALAAFPAFGALGGWAGRRGTALLVVVFVVGEVLLVGATLAPGHPIEPP